MEQFRILMKQIQLQKAIGELKALQVCLYDSATYNKIGDDSREKMDYIENVITNLKNL